MDIQKIVLIIAKALQDILVVMGGDGDDKKND